MNDFMFRFPILLLTARMLFLLSDLHRYEEKF